MFLDDCLNSILNQTFTNYEIIICDDCSTDNSVKLIQQYALKYSFIRTIYHTKNIGISMNRNSGLLLARGLYFTTIDQDDIYMDIQKLEKEMDIVKYYKEKENKIVCAFSKIAILDKDLNYLSDQWPESKIVEGYIFNEIITRSVMIPRDYIVAREAYLAVGQYDKLVKLYEDWDLKIRLAHKYDFYFTGIYGTGYRRHGQGFSNVSIPQNIRALKKVFNKNIHLVLVSYKQEVEIKFASFLNKMKERIIKNLKQEYKDTKNHKRTFLARLKIKAKIIYWKHQ